MINYFIDFGGGYKLLPNQILEYEVVDQDYDVDPERTIDGRLFRNRVAMIPEVTFTVRPLYGSEMSKLLAKLSNETFTATFFHPTYGKHLTAQFYCGPSSRKVKMRHSISNEIMYEPHTFTLTGIHNAK